MIIRCKHCGEDVTQSWAAGSVETDAWQDGKLVVKRVEVPGPIHHAVHVVEIELEDGVHEINNSGVVTWLYHDEYGCPLCDVRKSQLKDLFEVIDPATGKPPNPNQETLV